MRKLLSLILLLTFGSTATLAQDAPSFGREVRPILAKHCFHCHGPDPDTREADLRLDEQAAAWADLGGYRAIKPGDAKASELIVRVLSDDDDLRMPPADSSAPLSDADVEVLRRWINSGGVYETHWSFVPPTRPLVPEVQQANWCADPIDRFILHRIEQRGLQPTQPASRESLIRRLFLDLCGTTPSLDQVDRFARDDDPKAYQKLVDRLLASPEYSERFARPWLDLARYSDTNGYEKDRPRSIWPYRDWVIRALAADMPFDQFSIEQIAGDMLPDATNQQRIATGFHRNTMLNEEGGIDPQEYRFYAMVDRVATTGTVWLGLTTGCAQCHTHKYDPITHNDYYSLLALLNSADEPDVVVEDPQRIALVANIESQMDDAEQALIRRHLPSFEDFVARKENTDPIATAFDDWFQQQAKQSRSWSRLQPESAKSALPKLTPLEDDSILVSGDSSKRDVYQIAYNLDASQTPVTAIRLEVLPDDSLPAGGPGVAYYEGRRGDFFLSELRVTFNGQSAKLQDASHSFGKISVGSGGADAANVIDGEGSTGWATSGGEGKPHQWVANFANPISGPGRLEIELLFERHFVAGLGRFRFSITRGMSPVAASELPGQLFDWHVHAVTEVDRDDYAQLQKHFVRTSPEFAKLRKPIERLERSIPEVVRTLGMRQRPPEHHRTTHRHHRGEYLQPKETVSGAVPVAFPALDNTQPADRLSFARWLLSESNPLVARVTANRAWREFFGTGIVDTAGDFGTQSEPPSHPELLDWLAVELRSHRWSLQQLHRSIVNSATYRQALSSGNAEHPNRSAEHPNRSAEQLDPGNRLLSSFPHRRLDAEQIRDSILSASGLLSRRVGGPSVYPPQPASVTEMAYGSPPWKTSTEGDRYRRSIYTFSKRTAPFAAFTTFDGPTGEVCIARRDRSTTPLQALTLLNDPMYMELARGLAESTIAELGSDAEPRTITERIFRKLLVRPPTGNESDAILRFYESQQSHDEPWTLVARALMNTDEAITVP